MDLIQVLITLAIGGIAGWLAGQILSRNSLGLLGNIIVGLLGAILAGFLLPGVIPIAGILGQIVSATIGAVILLVLYTFARRRRRR